VGRKFRESVQLELKAAKQHGTVFDEQFPDSHPVQRRQLPGITGRHYGGIVPLAVRFYNSKHVL
jgi:hypothetical protein